MSEYVHECLCVVFRSVCVCICMCVCLCVCVVLCVCDCEFVWVWITQTPLNTNRMHCNSATMKRPVGIGFWVCLCLGVYVCVSVCVWVCGDVDVGLKIDSIENHVYFAGVPNKVPHKWISRYPENSRSFVFPIFFWKTWPFPRQENLETLWIYWKKTLKIKKIFQNPNNQCKLSWFYQNSRKILKIPNFLNYPKNNNHLIIPKHPENPPKCQKVSDEINCTQME